MLLIIGADFWFKQRGGGGLKLEMKTITYQIKLKSDKEQIFEHSSEGAQPPPPP